MTRQLCPICKKDVRPHLRYAYYLCDNCINRITDRHNQPVVYISQNTPKGFYAFYKNQPDKIYLYDICYIDGKEFKATPDKGKYIFIQPVDFLEYASRPDEINHAPTDPENGYRSKKGILLFKKILLPAALSTLLCGILPPVSGLFLMNNETWSILIKILIFGFINLSGLIISLKIILFMSKKFSKAEYFKQHSWSFFVIGIILFMVFLKLITT